MRTLEKLYLHKFGDKAYLIKFLNDPKGFRTIEELVVDKNTFFLLKNQKIKNFIPYYKFLVDHSMYGKYQISGSFGKFYPISLIVEITNYCNQNCLYCFMNSVEQFKKAKFMKFSYFKNIIKKLKRKGLLSIKISGGECSFHPDFEKIVIYCIKNFQEVEILTNGANGKKIINILLKLKENEKKKMNVSLGINHWTKFVEEIIQKKHYVNEFIEKIIKIRPLRIILTDFIFNCSLADEINNFFKKYSNVIVEFNLTEPVGRAYSILKYEQYNQNKKELKKFNNDYDSVSQDRLDSDFNPLELNCEFLLKHLCISADGLIRPCPLFDKTYLIKDLFSINNKKPYILKSLEEIPAPNEKLCGSCELLDYCKNCILRGYFHSNFVDIKNFDCIFNKKYNWGILNEVHD